MNCVRVGVGVCIINNGKFLIGERLSKHGINTFSFPGGHLEFGEDWFDTAIRETKEETNLDIKEMKLLGITNDKFSDSKQYITIFIVAKYEGDKVINCEPEKCTGWKWCSIDEVEENKFLSLENLYNSELLEKLKEELEKSKSINTIK